MPQRQLFFFFSLTSIFRREESRQATQPPKPLQKQSVEGTSNGGEPQQHLGPKVYQPKGSSQATKLATGQENTPAASQDPSPLLRI